MQTNAENLQQNFPFHPPPETQKTPTSLHQLGFHLVIPAAITHESHRNKKLG
jgi:hypothetical protein